MHHKVIQLHLNGYSPSTIYTLLHGEVSITAIEDACINYDLEQSKSK